MMIRRKSTQQTFQAIPSVLPLIFFAICFTLVPANSFAGLILGAELRLTYEDNVVGLLSDQPRGAGGAGGGTMMPAMGIMQRPGTGGTGGPTNNNRYIGSGSGSTQHPGDFSATLSAEAGGYQDVGSNLAVFAKGFAQHQSYNTYTDLDATIGGASAGVSAALSETVFLRVAALGKLKRFGDSARDSNAYAGDVSLKEKLTPTFWLREYGEYEKNHADNAVFSYNGTLVGAGLGYLPLKKTLLTFGYSYLVRKFDEPSGAEIKTSTVYVGTEQSFTKSWSIAGEYDLQISKENITGSSTTDNIFSLALRYSY